MKNIVLTLALLTWPAVALAFSGGPPDGRTDAPRESNCTDCHASFALNSGLGMITIDGVPGGWQPSMPYDLTVTLEDPDAARWGFEFTILDGAGASTGTLTLLDATAQLSTSGNRTYAKHTSAGTRPGTSVSSSWTVRWTAPPAGVGDISIYVAANGADNNNENNGDRIYTASATWLEGALSGTDLPLAAAVRLLPNHPNPFNPRTTIAYELAGDASVRLAVYGVDGRLVRRLVNRFEAAGRHDVIWDGRDEGGRASSSGVYFYRLETGGEVMSRRMTLVR